MNKALLILVAMFTSITPVSAKYFLFFCTLDREGTGKEFCEEHKSIEITSMEISEPRYSIYNFVVVNSFTGSSCPPEKKVSYRGVWDRVKRKATETGGAPVVTRTTDCTRNPWTTEGVIHQSNYWDVACSSDLPVTSTLLTPASKYWILSVLEPLYTRCKVTSPVGFAATSATQNTSLPVVVAHNEHQELVWQVVFQNPGGEKKIITSTQQPFLSLSSTTTYNNQIAETTSYLWLNEPGLYWITPGAKLKSEYFWEDIFAPINPGAGTPPQQPLACFPAAFVKVGNF